MAELQTITLNGDQVGDVKVGDTLLPGVFQRMGVQQELRTDTSTVRGRSGSTKLPTGWEDARVSLELTLLADGAGTVAEKLKAIADVFLSQDDKGRPRLYTITHWHLVARGIRYVIFKGLDTDDDNQSDLATCSLRFEQHAPPTRKVERRQPRASRAGTVGNGQTVETSAVPWLSEGVTLAGPDADPEYSYYDTGMERIAPVTPEQSAAYQSQRPSVDEDVPS